MTKQDWFRAGRERAAGMKRGDPVTNPWASNPALRHGTFLIVVERRRRGPKGADGKRLVHVEHFAKVRGVDGAVRLFEPAYLHPGHLTDEESARIVEVEHPVRFGRDG